MTKPEVTKMTAPTATATAPTATATAPTATAPKHRCYTFTLHANVLTTDIRIAGDIVSRSLTRLLEEDVKSKLEWILNIYDFVPVSEWPYYGRIDNTYIQQELLPSIKLDADEWIALKIDVLKKCKKSHNVLHYFRYKSVEVTIQCMNMF